MAGEATSAAREAAVAVDPATPRDADLLVPFVLAVASESEGRTLDKAVVRRGVEASLADPAHRRYFIARRAGAPVGALFITTEWSDWTASWYWWLQSVYVVPEARGTLVLEALAAHVEEAARRAGVRLIRLYMHTGNERARRAYRRIGYQEAPYRVFERPVEGQRSWVDPPSEGPR